MPMRATVMNTAEYLAMKARCRRLAAEPSYSALRVQLLRVADDYAVAAPRAEKPNPA